MTAVLFSLSLRCAAPDIPSVAEFFALYCKSQDFTLTCGADEQKDCSQTGCISAMPLKGRSPPKTGFPLLDLGFVRLSVKVRQGTCSG